VEVHHLWLLFHGCSIEVGLNSDGKAVSARGVGDADVNRGKLCIKGILEYELFETPGRGRVPLLRNRRDETFQQASWDQALMRTTDEIKRIQSSTAAMPSPSSPPARS